MISTLFRRIPAGCLLVTVLGTSAHADSPRIVAGTGHPTPDATVSEAFGAGCSHPLFGNPEFAAGNEPRAVAAADLDGDLILDLVVANGFGGNVSVLLGNGDGTFAEQLLFDVGDRPLSVAIGDLDGDLNLDLVVANQDSDDVSVLLGNGDGTFADQVVFSAGNGPFFVAVGDLDGDLDLDLVVAHWLSHAVTVLLGKGDGTFAAPVSSGQRTTPPPLATSAGARRPTLPSIVAHIHVSTRRSLLHFASACPYQDVFRHASPHLHHYPLRC